MIHLEKVYTIIFITFLEMISELYLQFKAKENLKIA